jgi:hypothetical protein
MKTLRHNDLIRLPDWSHTTAALEGKIKVVRYATEKDTEE